MSRPGAVSDDVLGQEGAIGVLVAGPAGSGKSCIVGKLLCECGGADPKAVLQYEKAAQERLKRPAGSGLAWVTDTLPRERRGGHTLRCSWSRIAGGVSLIDTPGLATRLAEFHRGLAQPGAAMFLCSAAPEEFERSIFEFRERGLAALAAGIRSFVCVVAKMDAKGVCFTQQRYRQVAEFMTKFFVAWAKSATVVAVPVSARVGANVTVRGDKLGWFRGPTVLGALEALRKSAQSAPLGRRSLRFTVVRRAQLLNSTGGQVGGKVVVAMGRVQSGCAQVGQRLLVAPGGVSCRVVSIEAHGDRVPRAETGALVGLGLVGILPTQLSAGQLIGDARVSPPRAALRIEAFVRVVAQPYVVARGSRGLILRVHAAGVPVRVESIRINRDGPRGQGEEGSPTEALRALEIGVVVFSPLAPIALETKDEHGPLGRFCLYTKRRLVGVGTIRAVQYAGAVEEKSANAKRVHKKCKDLPNASATV